MSDELGRVLAERGKTHGSYDEMCAVIQALKAVMHAAPGWRLLPATLRESLEMECVKNGRILTGDPLELDHWMDKAGYARLAYDTIARGKGYDPTTA